MDISVIGYTHNYRDIIYTAGKNCYGIKDDIGRLEAKKLSDFSKMIIRKGHESVIEHVSITLKIENVSRSFLAQITRHRLASFSVKSQHFVTHRKFKYKELENYGDKNEAKASTNRENRPEYLDLMKTINSFYCKLLDSGVERWIAREVLPNACLTDIVMTVNLREMRHIIKLRITKNNTPEIKLFAEKTLEILNNMMPELVEDLNGLEKF